MLIGSELYQEALTKALAKHFQACLIILDSSNLEITDKNQGNNHKDEEWESSIEGYSSKKLNKENLKKSKNKRDKVVSYNTPFHKMISRHNTKSNEAFSNNKKI